MKKELLKGLAIAGVAGIGIGICGLIVANRAAKKAEKEIVDINKKTADDEMDNLKARIERLEYETMRQDHRNLYFGVCGFLVVIYMWNEIDKNFRHVQEKHNGLCDHVQDYLNICFENFAEAEERLTKLEVK